MTTKITWISECCGEEAGLDCENCYEGMEHDDVCLKCGYMVAPRDMSNKDDEYYGYAFCPDCCEWGPFKTIDREHNARIAWRRRQHNLVQATIFDVDRLRKKMNQELYVVEQGLKGILAQVRIELEQIEKESDDNG
tara:strand:- start:2362 stop:2769 length:408 start_codon:yes stop_codon:yes gene_type:complete